MSKFWEDPGLPVYDKSMDLKQMKKEVKEAEATKDAGKA